MHISLRNVFKTLWLITRLSYGTRPEIKKNRAPSLEIRIGSWSKKPTSWQASSFRSNQNVLKPQGRKKCRGKKKRHGVED